MPQIQSEKPLKKCPECGKEVRNLGFHIANIHPKLLEKLDVYKGDVTESSIPHEKAGSSSNINEMIREKLDTMLNIKIIEMLSKGGSLADVQQALNPPTESKPVGIEEIKQYHDLIYKEPEPAVNLNIGESDSAGWLNLANNAIPIIKDLVGKREEPPKKELEDKTKNDESGTIKEGVIRPIKAISGEVTGDSTESSINGEKSGVNSEPKQQARGDVPAVAKDDD